MIEFARVNDLNDEVVVRRKNKIKESRKHLLDQLVRRAGTEASPPPSVSSLRSIESEIQRREYCFELKLFIF